jgi:hypothetical protein
LVTLVPSSEELSALEQGQGLLYSTCPSLLVEPVVAPRQLLFVGHVLTAFGAVGICTATPAHGHSAIGLGRMVFVEPGSYKRCFR